MADDEKFLVVPLGKKSKAITQTVSNDTAMEIMELLAEGPMSTSKVAEKLGIPLTTAQYNIEKLMESALVKIAKTKYSEKGREVKLYEAMNRAIIILPGKSGTSAVMDALKRYLILLPVAILVSLAVEYLLPLYQGISYMSSDASEKSFVSAGGQQPLLNAVNSTLAAAPMPTEMPVMAPTYEASRSVLDQAGQAVLPWFQHSGVLFFAGCLLVLFLLIIIEYARYSRVPWLKK
jgi:predicted transcriptional regulator